MGFSPGFVGGHSNPSSYLPGRRRGFNAYAELKSGWLRNQDQSTKSRQSVRLYDIHGVKVHTTPSEKPIMQDLFDSLSQIPTGREAIKDMKKYNVDVFYGSMGRYADSYHNPQENVIGLNNSATTAFLEKTLVYHTRRLRQYNLGANKMLSGNLDLASRVMLERAREADAQTQCLLACKEWEAIGYDAPIEDFVWGTKTMIEAYNKTKSPSDAFKAWYESNSSSSFCDEARDYCERMLKYDLYERQSPEKDDSKYISLMPADIAKCCNGDRVDGFEDFINSKQARQIYLLTKTTAELYDEKLAAQGFPRDPSLATIPVRDLKDAPIEAEFAQLRTQRYIRELKDIMSRHDKHDKQEKETRRIAISAVKAVEKINEAAIKGKTNPGAEKLLEAAKKRMGDAFRPADSNNKKTPQSFLNKLSVALKKNNSR